jgi:hypothetical protein
MTVLPLDIEISADEALRCPACGAGTDDDNDPVYVTAFIPGTGKTKITAPMCPPHAVEVRNRAQIGAEHLEPRTGGVQGLAPEHSPAPVEPDVWAALGITPRG